MVHSFNLPPMEGLDAFLAAAEAGSFSAAAEALHVTHASISRRVGAVERWIGTSLFERHGRGVRLNPAGQRFAAEARRTLEALERSAERWRPRRARETVRLSVVPSFAKLWLLPRLAAIEGASGDLHVELIVEHRVSHLEGREADLAVRYGRGGWEGVDAARLLAETLVPAASPDLVRRFAPQAHAERMLDVPLIHDSDFSQWRSWLSEHGIAYRPRSRDRRFEDYDTALAAAEAGLGVVLARLPFATGPLRSGRLIAMDFEPRPNALSHFVVSRRGEARPHVLRLAERLHAFALNEEVRQPVDRNGGA